MPFLTIDRTEHAGGPDRAQRATPPKSSAGLEERLSRIEEIASLLDSDTLGLDDALALFEEGVGHIRSARELLDAAELRVEELIGEKGDDEHEVQTSAPGSSDLRRNDRG